MMDKVVEKFSFEELLGLLAPGFAALVAIQLLTRRDLIEVLGPRLSRESLPATAAVLIAAYCLGILLFEWVNAGTRFFMALHLELLAFRSNRSRPLKPSWWRWLMFFPVGLLHGMPLPRIRRSFVETQVMMCEFIETTSHTFEGSRISSPWDRLDMFQKLFSRVGGELSTPVLKAASEVHRKLQFVLSFSLVICIAAIIALIRCISSTVHSRHLSGPFMAMAVLSLVSCSLRGVAARYWETEITLVCSLAAWRS
jgi:hypothetical protein